ncbi:MAG: hypothetical protein RMY34_17575 [Aulosira sp. DedQUE10]|nr:hypothetical protein [Aulosira sp. DedQUE10]
MATTTTSVYHNPYTETAPAYPPSVPLSVYRELADELQTAQAQLDALTSKNQKLVQENQLLRQEITKVVQSLLHLQKFVDVPTPSPAMPRDRPAPHPTPDVKGAAKPFGFSSSQSTQSAKTATASPPAKEARPRQQVSRTHPPAGPEVSSSKSDRSYVSVPVTEMMSLMPQPVLIEEEEVRYYRPTESEVKEVSGWWLVISILLIMLTAFSAGYLVVRPLFEHQSR